MKVVPFRKPSHFVSPGDRVQKNDGKLGYQVEDDFSDEIEIIRANESLMATLEARAKQPATVSLWDVKHQIENEEEE